MSVTLFQPYSTEELSELLSVARKAGWKSSYWSTSIRIQTFEVTSQKEAFYIQV